MQQVLRAMSLFADNTHTQVWRSGNPHTSVRGANRLTTVQKQKTSAGGVIFLTRTVYLYVYGLYIVLLLLLLLLLLLGFCHVNNFLPLDNGVTDWCRRRYIMSLCWHSCPNSLSLHSRCTFEISLHSAFAIYSPIPIFRRICGVAAQKVAGSTPAGRARSFAVALACHRARTRSL